MLLLARTRRKHQFSPVFFFEESLKEEYRKLQKGIFSSLNGFHLTLLFITSWFWPRVRARALRAPVFLSSLPRQTGRCAPPLPAHRSFAVSYLTPKKYIKFIQLGPPTSRTFFFPPYRRGYEVPCPPVPPIAALLILQAIFWGQKYIPVRPYEQIFSVFLFFSFWIVFFCVSLLFLSPFQFLLILLFLSLLILLVGLFFVSYSSLLYYILPFLILLFL